MALEKRTMLRSLSAQAGPPEFGSVSGGGCNQRQPARMPPTSAPHIPVLLSEVVTAIAPAKGDIYLDGTFGAGGYTRAVLEAAGCSVLALDRDPQALADADLVDAFGARLTLVEGCFGDMEALAQDAGLPGGRRDARSRCFVHATDQPARGFSFMRDGPLDMRMGATGTSAEDLVNEADPALLVSILSVYGEERARAPLCVRFGAARNGAHHPHRRTGRDCMQCAGSAARQGCTSATRTFQALRIYLNDELGELLRGLHAAERLLRPGGRLVVVTFHSLEDRMVKKFLANRSGRAGRPASSAGAGGPASSFEELPKRTQKAGADELARNSRARSARLRGRCAPPHLRFPKMKACFRRVHRSSHKQRIGGRP